MSTSTWAIDSLHSSAEFDLQHMHVSTYRGRFRVVQGTLFFDEANPANSKLTAEIHVKSVDVEPGPLLDRLLGEEFFHAAEHPTLRYESTRIEKVGADHYRAQGTLRIRGVEKPVTLEFEALGGANHPFTKKAMKAFRAKSAINRGDFGMKWNAPLDTGAAYLGEQVNISLHVELEQKDGAQ